MWDLCRQHGEKVVRVWLELLSIADRNEGDVPGQLGSISTAVAWQVRVKTDKCRRILDSMTALGWLNVDGGVRVPNYAKYHITRDAKEIPHGNQKAPLPSEPPKPNPLKTDIRISPQSPGETPASEDWHESMVFIKTFLGNGAPPLTHPELLFDNDWWVDVHDSVNGFDRGFLEREFARMSAWLKENPNRMPNLKPKFFKKFVRHWIEIAKDKERRTYAKSK